MEEIIIQGETKKCVKCLETKKTSDFCKTKRNKDRLQSYCKKCQNQLRKELTEKRIKNGLCPSCGLLKQDNKYLCQPCGERNKVYVKKYVHTEKRKLQHKTKKYLNWKKNYLRKRYSTNINFRLSAILRSRLHRVRKGRAKSGSAVRDLGCTVEDLKIHLEKQFLSGMTWENYGLGNDKWNIDHIIPLRAVDLTDREQFLKVCHYTNLRPLWQINNIRRNITEK